MSKLFLKTLRFLNLDWHYQSYDSRFGSSIIPFELIGTDTCSNGNIDYHFRIFGGKQIVTRIIKI